MGSRDRLYITYSQNNDISKVLVKVYKGRTLNGTEKRKIINNHNVVIGNIHRNRTNRYVQKTTREVQYEDNMFSKIISFFKDMFN